MSHHLRSMGVWWLIAIAAAGCSGGGAALVNNAATAPQSRLETVRGELVATFAARMRAYEAKDFATLINQIAPNYVAIRPDGTRMSREDLTAYIRRNLDRWVRIIASSNEIEGLRLEGDNAVADMRQGISRIQIVDGHEAVVESRVLQTETWTPTSEGWKLLSVQNEREMSLTIDGRPVG